MLSQERINQVRADADLRARTLSDNLLRKEAANLHVEHRDAPTGDERTELGIMENAYTGEMIRRGLVAK
jgi:hypothetical protein